MKLLKWLLVPWDAILALLDSVKEVTCDLSYGSITANATSNNKRHYLALMKIILRPSLIIYTRS